MDRLETFLQSRVAPGLRLTIKRFHGCPAAICDMNSPYMAAAKSAIEQGFGTPPVLIREGGSIPVVATFKQLLGVDTLLLGWGQNTENLHSPNEHFSIDAFQKGTRSSAYLWGELGKIANSQ